MMSNPAAKINLERFEAFVKERDNQGDWDDYTLPDRFDLNKKMIARECEFDRKRITGNSKIKEKYDEVVCKLLEKGILLENTNTPPEQRQNKQQNTSNSRQKAELKKTLEINIALEEELFQTKAELDEANKKLERFEAIERYMMETGRL